jgi:hypothetical protein
MQHAADSVERFEAHDSFGAQDSFGGLSRT